MASRKVGWHTIRVGILTHRLSTSTNLLTVAGHSPVSHLETFTQFQAPNVPGFNILVQAPQIA